MNAAIKSRLVWIWCIYIVISQTGAAGQLANELFDWLFGGERGGANVLHFLLQKGYHVFLFGVFGWLLTSPLGRRSWRTCLLWCVGLGAASEALQLLAEGRSPTVSDAVLNVVAASLAVWLSWRLRSRAVDSQPGAAT